MTVLLLRLILAVLLAFLIGRFFFSGTSMFNILGLAAIMLVLAYLFEYTRKKDKGGKNGT